MNMIFSAGIEFCGTARQFDAIHLGHDDIGQQQVEGLLLDFFEGAGTFAKGRHSMASLFQRIHQKASQVFVVFCQNDACHFARMFRQSAAGLCAAVCANQSAILGAVRVNRV